jgi:hypothetical protein
MSRGEEDGPKPAQKEPELAGPFRPAQGVSGLVRPAFDLAPSRSICSSLICRHIDPIILLPPITRKSSPQDEGESWMSSSQGSTPVEGKEARGGLQAAGLGVFASFIAAIFIDDVLRSLHQLYVLQSL